MSTFWLWKIIIYALVNFWQDSVGKIYVIQSDIQLYVSVTTNKKKKQVHKALSIQLCKTFTKKIWVALIADHLSKFV